MDTWKQKVKDEIAKARALGKMPKQEPQTDADWDLLRSEFPSSLYASWFVLTGRRVR